MRDDVTHGAPDGILLIGRSGNGKRTRGEGTEVARFGGGEDGEQVKKCGEPGESGEERKFLYETTDRFSSLALKMQSTPGGLSKALKRSRGVGKAPDAMLQRKVPLQRQAGRGAAEMPVVRDVCANEHQIAGLEQFDVIGNETSAGAALDEGEFHRGMVMPVVAMTHGGRGGARGAHHFHPAKTLAPAQDPAGLTGGQSDVFAGGVHGRRNDAKTPR